MDVAARGYLVLAPTFSANGQLKSMKIDRVTRSFPQRLADGERVVPITISVPVSVFGSLPQVAIHVPEGDVIVPEVTVG
jgi:hypothetical protein